MRQLSVHGQLLLEPGFRSEPEAEATVDQSVRGMIGQLNANPHEVSLQRPVDLGHTVSGAFEVATNYRLAHGEAVALDLALFGAAATILGRLHPSDLDEILTLMQKFDLAVWHPVMSNLDVVAAGITASVAHRGRRLNTPLPVAIGHCEFVEDTHDLPLTVLAEAAALCEERHRQTATDTACSAAKGSGA